jgi:outer membrane protein assembly factor BamE (lipoprotein component of BamABCDE complex)
MGNRILLLLLLLVSCNQNENSEIEKNYSNEFSVENLLKVKIGMRKDSVISLLGAPVKSTQSLFTYTEKRVQDYPMVWIGFNEDDLVSAVSVKYYYWVEDRGVYNLSINELGKLESWGENSLEKYFN